MENSLLARGYIDAIAGRLTAVIDEDILSNPHLNTAVARAEGVRYATRIASLAALHGEVENADYPRTIPMCSLWFQIGFNNPDGDYRYANIHGDHVYRLFGHRGTARVFDVELWSGDMKDLSTVHQYGGIRHIHLDPAGPFVSNSDLKVEPDGSFELILSATEQPGNWIKIPDGVGTVVMREIFYDWEAERHSETYFERVGAVYPPPLTTEDDINHGLESSHEFIANIRMLAKGLAAQHYSLMPNTISSEPMHLGQTERGRDSQLALRGIRFLQGYYECAPEQAVILEAQHHECPHWNYYLTSHNWESGDYDVRQSSLNGAQAAIDRDGVFRAVIAQRDPGVPNWLDTGGRSSGLIVGRFLTDGQAPLPQLTVVQLDEVRKYLPEYTAVVSPAERSETIRRRMHAVRRRLVQG